MTIMKSKIPIALIALFSFGVFSPASASAQGWLNWRGPNQNGTSNEKTLPDTIDAKNAIWVADLAGASAPVIANGKIYANCFWGDGADLKEGVVCLEVETGKELWRHGYTDFISDTVYQRYSSSSPTVDPETGNVYFQGTQGIFAGFTADGKLLWLHSLMEEFGRLTFPNARTASPVIDRDLVITRGITANWGANGPASDRFYAFDKKNGALVWASTPGDRPKDNSYSYPVLGFLNGKRVFYAATGDGAVVCVNARTGEPQFRVPLFKAGINSSVVVHNNDKIIAIYGTPYEPGQMVALKIPQNVSPTNSTDPIVIPRKEVELWSNEIRTSASSPILANDRVYVTSEVGDLVCVSANDGKILWKLKLGIEQRNASPLFADGKLYVPILNDPDRGQSSDESSGGAGALYVVQSGDAEGKILSKTTLDGRCFAAPSIWNGKIYVQTTRHLYCFGKKGGSASLPDEKFKSWPEPGKAAQLQIIPSEVLLRPGQTQSFHIRALDTNGFTVEENIDANKIMWAPYIPPTAKVKAGLNALFNDKGELAAATNSVPSAGAFEATWNGIKGYIRGRILPYPPLKQDFEWANLTETTTNTIEEPTKFAYPPLPWIGARFKFEIREKDGNKVLTKTIDNKFLQRATVFMGSPEAKNYTIEADVMSEGNKRKMSDVGIICQRYLIVLKGNEQKLEINSNLERLRVPAAEDPPNFKWSPNVWYRVKARVDTNSDGSGVVRAKAWKKDEPEPDKWTLEVPHKTAHQQGSPGLFGFSPQEMRVFIDNISVMPN